MNEKQHETLEKYRFLYSQVSDPKYILGEDIGKGIVISICNGLFYQFTQQRDFNIWDDLDSNWREKPVYTLCLHELSRPVTYEQYKTRINPYSNYEEYEANVKEALYLTLIEQEIDNNIEYLQ